jgi:pentose-5-phosphate-3-epimerase
MRFGGQSFLPEMLPKILRLRARLLSRFAQGRPGGRHVMNAACH